MTAPEDGTPERTLRVALLGCGVVGTEVARLLTRDADELGRRLGARIELVGVAIRRLDRRRDVELDPALVTTDAHGLVTRGDVDVVVEVIGGIEPARSLILAALESGASVVTANKTLLAEDHATLSAAAERADRDLFFEAAVAGAIPIVRPLAESLAGDRVRRVLGIVNGTTNYVLDAMTTGGLGFDEALGRAQELGYAEADPTADVEGYDAASKAALLATLAFHTRVTIADVHREGIADVTAADVRSARAMGCVVKLLAICERHDTPEGSAVSARVHPAMIPLDHPLASVREAYNAVFVESVSSGRLMFYGPGAGGAPTASAVLGDVLVAARHRLDGVSGPGESVHADSAIQDMGGTSTRYHLAVDVDDKAGVLASVAHEFAEYDVSIRTMHQEGRGADAQLVIVTHEAPDAALAATVEALTRLPTVHEVTSVMRVEGES